MKKSRSTVPRQIHDRDTLLERILGTPGIEHAVPSLRPELLHRVIQDCGLEDCGSLMMMATPEQWTRVFDLDLWRVDQPGMDEQFDARRFGLWIEVLAQAGVEAAARKIAEVESELLITGLAAHARVFDSAAARPYRTTDGVEVRVSRPDHELTAEIGAYTLFASRTDSWEAILAVLIELDAQHPECFHRLMRGCRALSDDGRELDGLDGLLARRGQAAFDLARARERRRGGQGYVAPAQARAFLKASREIRLDAECPPPEDPGARAILRQRPDPAASPASPDPPTPASPADSKPSPEARSAASALAEIFSRAGISGAELRALPGESHTNPRGLDRLRTLLRSAFDRSTEAYDDRSRELTFIANALKAGCAFQDRQLTAAEAGDAASAVCSLGLENWPAAWGRGKSLPEDFLAATSLVAVFQVGWAVLHRDVAMHAALGLLKGLAGLRVDDRDIQSGLDALTKDLTGTCRTGTPWRSRAALDAIAIFDMPAWAALLGAIDECPVLHAVLGASGTRTGSVGWADFEFISNNAQIAVVHRFLETLPAALVS